MICVIDGSDAVDFAPLFDAAERLCGLSKKAASASGRICSAGVGSRFCRIDQRRAVHHFCIENGSVVGYQCMMPTLGPTLLATVFPTLCAGTPPRAANIYELSLHHIREGWREGRRGFSETGAELIAGCLEWGLAHGINKIIIEAEPYWILRAMQLGFVVRPLGPQQIIGSRALVAIELAFDAATLNAVRDYRGNHTRVAHFCGLLSQDAARPAYAS